ncbi:MAG: XRE family transcriptional regulator [Alphaproteobacteria bacterium]|jgi:transcriptional regulator with XRE-family HTH domain|nr:XRE family transcriptional regulator [Alphaproteobacteria bacterium]
MSEIKNQKQRVDEIDRYIGNRLRLRRIMIGLTQEKLAEAFGVTAQQVQKYENGINRMGGSRLLQASQILKIPVQYFFEGLEKLEITEESPNGNAASSLLSSEITEFLYALKQIKSKKIRTQLLTFIKVLSKN